jgi:hypothetical protein
MEQAYKFAKPGGWVEFQDFDMKFYSTDGTFIPGSSPDVWTQEIAMSLRFFGREPEPGPKLEQWLLEAGFENISAQVLPIPVGLWPRDKRMVGHSKLVARHCCQRLLRYFFMQVPLKIADIKSRKRSEPAISLCFLKDLRQYRCGR